MVDGADGLVGQTLHLLIGEGFLVSFHRGASAVLAEVRRDYLCDFQRHAATPSFLIYEFWNEQVDQYLRLQSRLEQKVETMRLKLRTEANEATLLELADVHRRAARVRKRVMPTRRVLEELVARKTTLISEATLGYMSGMIATLERLLSDNHEQPRHPRNRDELLAHRGDPPHQPGDEPACRGQHDLSPADVSLRSLRDELREHSRVEWAHGYKFFWAVSALITFGLVLVFRRARLL